MGSGRGKVVGWVMNVREMLLFGGDRKLDSERKKNKERVCEARDKEVKEM